MMLSNAELSAAFLAIEAAANAPEVLKTLTTAQISALDRARVKMAAERERRKATLSTRRAKA